MIDRSAKARRIPKLRHHKPSNRAVVTLGGTDHYCGPWDKRRDKPTARAQDAYDGLIAEWLASGRRPADRDIALNELMLRYLEHVDGYYLKDGKPTKEPECMRLSLRPVRLLFGTSPAEEFSPLKLKAVRQSMIEAGLCRPEINRRVSRILRMFRWGVSEELVSATVLHALKAVDGLKHGRSAPREPEQIRPADEAAVEATLPYLLPPLRALVEILRLTGVRAGEICQMRTADIDRSGPVWRYTPARHKTQHRGRGRVIFLGPQAQAVLQPWLKPDDPQAPLFSPREGMRMRREGQRAARKTKVQPSQQGRRKADPKKAPGERYQATSVAHAIRRAVDRYNRETKSKGLDRPVIEPWHAHQLRHGVATRLRAEFGLEVAQVIQACQGGRDYIVKPRPMAV